MSMVGIYVFKAIDASLSMKWNPGLILCLFKYSVKSVKYCIISLSLLFFINVVGVEFQSYTYMTYIYLLPLIDVMGKSLHISE